MQTAAPEKIIGMEQTLRPAQNSGSLVVRMGTRFGVDPQKLWKTLKATAFRQRPARDGSVVEPTDEEMMALLIIADQYGLNPFTREIFAFFDPKSRAIVPVVSVDGWIRIINERAELRALKFTVSAETLQHANKICHVWMECSIKRSDRDEPIEIREYFDEVVRTADYSTPWDTHPNRMHRHKTLIQCARIAFGFGGIFDEDEAQRIIEGESSRVPEPSAAAVADINAEIIGAVPPAEAAAAAEVRANGGAMREAMMRRGGDVQTETVQDGAVAAASAELAGGGQTIPQTRPEAQANQITFAEIMAQALTAEKSKNHDLLMVAEDLARSVKDPQQRAELDVELRRVRKALEAK